MNSPHWYGLATIEGVEKEPLNITKTSIGAHLFFMYITASSVILANTNSPTQHSEIQPKRPESNCYVPF